MTRQNYELPKTKRRKLMRATNAFMLVAGMAGASVAWGGLRAYLGETRMPVMEVLYGTLGGLFGAGLAACFTGRRIDGRLEALKREQATFRPPLQALKGGRDSTPPPPPQA